MIPIVPVANTDRKLAPGTAGLETANPPGALRLQALPPLSLYVHYPWCVRKCPYCDFNSHEHGQGTEAIPETAYLDALRADLEQSLPLVWGRKVHTVFIGGGTPSLLSAAGLDRLLSDLRALLPIEADAEITLEANPGTFESAKFASYRASGINRLSIGIQSFNPAHLKALGRIHDGDQARRAIDIARVHFDNFNLDLMYGLPGQTVEQAEADLNTALSYEPPHLSLYNLTLEPNTVFAKYPPELPDEDSIAAMQDLLAARTATSGYRRYEISAYAKPGRQSRHNLNYWRFGDYLGIGAGAHGKISFPDRVLRQVRCKQPAAYLERAASGTALHDDVVVSVKDLPFEFMLNALRLTEGVPATLFNQRTGLMLGTVDRQLTLAESRGLLERDYLRLKPTALGLRFLNDLQEIFLED